MFQPCLSMSTKCALMTKFRSLVIVRLF